MIKSHQTDIDAISLPSSMAEGKVRVEEKVRSDHSDKIRTLYIGFPATTGSFAQDLAEELICENSSMDLSVIVSPAPDRFSSLPQFAGTEFLQKDDFEFRERIDQLHKHHSFVLSTDILQTHHQTEYQYLSISDRRCLTNVPVHIRRRCYRQLLAFWYDLLLSRRIDVVIFATYPHHGWNNVVVEIANALGLRIVQLDFTVVSETTFVSEVGRMHEPVPNAAHAHLSTAQLRAHIGRDRLERLAAPLVGINFSNQVKAEVELGDDQASYLSLLRGLMRNPKNRLRPSIARMSGSLSPSAMALEVFKAKRHVAKLESAYRQISTDQPDLSGPYIYFPLHMQPERSTMPTGGFFEDQILAAEILAASLPPGWALYIKEHPSQFWRKRAVKQAWFRYPGYYERLSALPNTKLIAIDFDSATLIRNSKVTATITGTAGWEALLDGKPCFAFGHPWYLGCRACYRIESLEDCSAALAEAKTLNESDVERRVLEFLLHYSDRILSVPFSPERRQMPPSEYEQHVSAVAKAVTAEAFSQRRLVKA